MRPNTKLFLATSLAFAAGIAVTIAFERAYAAEGFLRNSVDSAIRPPITPTKILFAAAAILVFTSIPIAIAEWLSERRFVRLERAMRAERPADAVTAYEGPEGRGFLFDGPGGRTLLLEPTAGVGEPRTVELPPVPETPPDPPAEASAETPP